ncbi:hypothetical protein HDU81_008641 [Chytriomyces hyalinus]|nr:hypothetical protein HDU81_008641 [Chytriomyces hyalinus]
MPVTAALITRVSLTLLLLLALMSSPALAQRNASVSSSNSSINATATLNASNSVEATSSDSIIYPQPSSMLWLYNASDVKNKTVSPNAIKPAARMMGLGWGLFICIAIGALLLMANLIASVHDSAGFFYFGSAVFMAVVVILLACLPRAPVGSVPDTVTSFDLTYYPRVGIMLLISVGALVGAGNVVAYYVAVPVYAINPDDD